MASDSPKLSTRQDFLIGFFLLLLLLTALLLTLKPWPQEGPTIKVRHVHPGGLGFDYQKLQDDRGFKIVVYGENIKETIGVEGKIVDRLPCNSKRVSKECASKKFTNPVMAIMEPGKPVTLTFRMADGQELKSDSGTYFADVEITSPPAPATTIPLNISPGWTYEFQDRMKRAKSDWTWLREPILAVIVAWIVAGFLVWLVVQWFLTLTRKEDLGPVELKVIPESDKKDANRTIDETQRLEFEALVKTRLDGLSIRPPVSQPAAGLETEVRGLLTEIAGPASKGMGSLISFIKDLIPTLRPRIGHSVECVLYKYGQAESNPASGEFHVTVTIKSAGSGATDVTTMESAKDIETLARRAASRIYLHAFHDRQKGWAPKWEHFHTVEGFDAYQRGLEHQKNTGLECQKNDELQAAVDAFRTALRLEPGNVLPRLAAASLLTQQWQRRTNAANAGATDANEENSRKARGIYEKIVEFNPDLIEPRYRLVANISMWPGKDKDPEQYRKELEEKRKEIRERLSFRFCLIKRLRKRNECGYWSQWTLLSRPGNCQRLMYQLVVDLAEKCFNVGNPTVEDQKEPINALIKLVRYVDNLVQPTHPFPEKPAFLHRLQHRACRYSWRRWGMDFWGARYLAACFYSKVLLCKGIDSYLGEHCKLAALEQLKKALLDPASADARDWALENDPDLKPLRELAPGFNDLKKYLRGELDTEERPAEPKVSDHARGALAMEID